MGKMIEVQVPDIGDFTDVKIIEVSVGPGDLINKEDPLITLESDKASMEIPSPHGGVVKEMRCKVGDKVSKGSPILILELTEGAGTPKETPEQPIPTAARPQESPAVAPSPGPASSVSRGKADVHAEVLVLGAGPGGYTAAFRAADLGKKTVLVERYPTLGGVCLNVGCIPSKALLHAAKVITEAAEMGENGISFGKPEINLDKLRGWKEKVVGRLTGGLAGLAKQRKVEVIQGVGKFVSPNHLAVDRPQGRVTVSFDHAIIAAGSQAAKIPGFPYDDPRVMDSTGALDLEEIPERLLVIGGGIIGLEMACFYYALGSKITVVEMLDALIPGVDKDIIRPLHKRIEKVYENIFLKTKVAKLEARSDGMQAWFEGANAARSEIFNRVLVAVGRRPNGKLIGAEYAGVRVDDHGFIPVDKHQRTNAPHIFAIGDIVGHPMLAHKATHEGRVAAEVIAGLPSAFNARVIPSVAYTDPEVAWVGLTENEAKEQKINYGKGVFPWAASGRSLSLGREDGFTKILFDNDSHRVIGVGIVGPNAGELIAEGTLAMEMGSDAEDICMTVHAHPTLSETLAMAAEAFEGTITDLYLPKKK